MARQGTDIMTLTIDMTPQLESKLRAEAAKQGLDASEYVLNALREHLRYPQRHDTPHLTQGESEWLQQINIGLPEETWQRYHKLIAKRRAETLTPDEQATLIKISDQIEKLNVNRVKHLVELARLRKVLLSTLMQRLGIETPPYV